MGKKLKTSLIINLTLIVIIFTLVIFFIEGTFSATEETKKVLLVLKL